jgi:hypothetical protein
MHPTPVFAQGKGDPYSIPHQTAFLIFEINFAYEFPLFFIYWASAQAEYGFCE